MSVPTIIAVAALKNRSAADKLLFKMAESGEIERVGRGQYGLPDGWEDR